MDIIEKIDDELALAGISNEDIKMQETIDSCIITPDMDIEPQEYLFRMFGKECFPRGELVSIQGKMKSGKTFFCSILMALCMRKELMGLIRNRESRLRLLWIDTEQSRMSTHKILRNRLRRMVGEAQLPMAQTNVLNLRKLGWRERLPLVEVAVKRFKPDLVVFDGVRDCVDDINDYSLATDVVTRLTQLASGSTRVEGDTEAGEEWPACCIVGVLHENKAEEDKSLRGAIGSELANKCWEAFEVMKDFDTEVFTVEQVFTREITIKNKFCFLVDNTGMPLEYSDDAYWRIRNQREEEMQRMAVKSSQGNIDLESIFSDILGMCNMRSNILYAKMKERLKIGGNKVKDMINDAIEQKIIVKDRRSAKEVYYAMAKSAAMLESSIFDDENIDPL